MTPESGVPERCPDCGTSLVSEPGVPGLCPQCLLSLALRQSPAAPPTDPTAAESGPDLVAKLRSLTNIRVELDPSAPEGWRLEVVPLPGCKTGAHLVSPTTHAAAPGCLVTLRGRAVKKEKKPRIRAALGH